MDKKTLKKLDEAFAFGCTDKEACAYADISPATLYNYQNEYPEYVERKEALKERPFLLARKSLIEGMQKDPHLALKYLERKKKDEFSLRDVPDAPPENPVRFVNHVSTEPPVVTPSVSNHPTSMARVETAAGL